MLTLKSNLPTYKLNNAYVLLRTDWNVAHSSTGTILDDFKLLASLETITYITQQQGHVIVLTHCGRPTKPITDLSTAIFVNWFVQRGFSTVFAATLEEAHALKNNNYQIIIIENMRFFKEEISCDKAFAQQCAALGDYYVQDAFGVCHRKSSSITILPTFFTPSNRTIGFLVEKELSTLNTFINHPEKPYTILQGGIKGETKIPLLMQLLDQIDVILLATPLCFTFLKALGKEIGQSAYEPACIQQAKQLLDSAKEKNITIVFPLDYQVTKNNFTRPYPLTETDTIKNDEVGISIGPKTTELFKSYIQQSKTVFMNGLPGNCAYQETLEGSRILLQAVKRVPHYLIGGGDSLAIVKALHLTNPPSKHYATNHTFIDHLPHNLSTGGGATLAYLSNQPLIGLSFF